MQQTPPYMPPPYSGPPAASVQQQPASIPGNVYQQAAMYQLENLTAVYKPIFTNPFIVLALAVVVTIVDIGLLVLIYDVGFVVYVTIAIPFVAIAYAINAFIHYNKRVYVFNNGLIYAKGSQLDVVRWDQVAAVWQNVTKSRYGTMTYRYTVRRVDGTTYKFNSSLRGVANLGAAIQNNVKRVSMPRAIAAYNSGAPVAFGPITLSLQGISYGNKLLPWSESQGVFVQQGYVQILRLGNPTQWARVKIASIPNFLVLLDLVNYARGARS